MDRSRHWQGVRQQAAESGGGRGGAGFGSWRKALGRTLGRGGRGGERRRGGEEERGGDQRDRPESAPKIDCGQST
ncbi:MAG: hypothetical protein FJ257_12330, partial [Phycisphaerae bacterium]|nr:hypothetical protein [Phycisphaerae bacterium]